MHCGARAEVRVCLQMTSVTCRERSIGKGHRKRGIAGMCSDIDGHIPWSEKCSQFGDLILAHRLGAFCGVLPLSIFDPAIDGQFVLDHGVGVLLEFRPEAEHVDQFTRFQGGILQSAAIKSGDGYRIP